MDTWHGVVLNGDGCVTALYLNSKGLVGTIPPEIGNFTDIESLRMPYNPLLIGTIPIEIGNLNTLTYLSMASCGFSGNIPTQIWNLTNLTHFYLHNNQLSGNIPAQIGNLTNLTYLTLRDNQFTGTLPAELGNLSSLIYLHLHNNQLNGCYDSNLSNLCSQLITGTNAKISDGNSFDTPWEDFCSTNTGICNGGVFPGDCNTDGIVNTDDALYWGLAEGFVGAVRPNATTDCSPQACSDWSQSVNNINSKHQDGDGNGIIDGQDLQVIISNYACINNYTAPSYVSNTPIYRIQPLGINNDGKYEYDLYVENGTGGAAIAHGLAFTVSSNVIPITAVTMGTMNSSLNPDAEFAILDGNQCHAVLTRTDNFDVTCGGPIATFLVATNDVPVGVPFEIDITYGSKIKADATLDNITGASAFGMYNGIGPSGGNLTLDASVTHEKCDALGEAIAIPSGGMLPYTYTWSTGANGAQVSNLTSGSYTVTVSDANGLNQSLTLQIIEGCQ